MSIDNQTILPGLPTPTDYHDFKERLAYADANSDLLHLTAFYAAAFPHMDILEKVKDELLQKQGIDTMMTLKNGKKIFFDEKIREEEYPDILIEEFSVWHGYPMLNGRKIGWKEFPKGWKRFGLKPGWVSGKKHTDYITYVKPSGKAFFIPFLLLQRAWLKHYLRWLKDYGRRAAKNEAYFTTNIPIPTDILYSSLYEIEKWS